MQRNVAGHPGKRTSVSKVMRSMAHAFALPPAVSSLDEAREVIDQQSRTIERLQFLVEASKVLNSTADLPRLLGLILDIATCETAAERGTVFLVDSKRNEIWSVIAHGLTQREIRLPMGNGVAGYVAKSGQMVRLDDAYHDPRFNPEIDQSLGFRTQTMLCVPVKDREHRITGVLQLLNKVDGGFTDDDVEFLEGISVHIAIALENASLNHERTRTQFMERELDVARHIQESLVPQQAPEIKGLDIAFRHESSFVVGGDYYDFLSLDSETFLFVVGDVEGKGVASALVMSNLQATLNALALHVHSLERILYSLNESILRNTLGAKFMTLFLGLIDLPHHGLHYVNAGHNPPIIIPAAGGEPAELTEGGMAIGMFPRVRYKRGVYQLAEGDIVLAYTDGITEAQNLRGEQYGEKRMVSAATELRDQTAQEIADGVFDDCAGFSHGGGFADDKVVLTIKVGPL
jgi:serine phosphatase RsbU (regulator of sigma subunit)